MLYVIPPLPNQVDDLGHQVRPDESHSILQSVFHQFNGIYFLSQQFFRSPLQADGDGLHLDRAAMYPSASVQASHPEPQFEEATGSVTVPSLIAGYSPPYRIEHDLKDWLRRLLPIPKCSTKVATSSFALQIWPTSSYTPFHTEPTYSQEHVLIIKSS